MARKRSTRKKSNAPPAMVIFAVLIIAGLYFAYARSQKPAGVPYVAATSRAGDEKIIFGGIPKAAPGAGEEVAFSHIRNQAYMVGYSDTRRNPLWAAYRVFRTETPFNFQRPSAFSTDTRTAARVKSGDYSGSGYERGHMAPNSAIVRNFGRDAQIETFLLSNICPQSPSLNGKVWERLESMEKSYADKLEEVWVIGGPIFADLNGGQTDRLASGIAVPSAFFKIIIDEEGGAGGRPRIFAVIMPQNVKGTEFPQEFLTNVDEIEKQTRFDFLWMLDAAMQAELESKVHKMW